MEEQKKNENRENIFQLSPNANETQLHNGERNGKLSENPVSAKSNNSNKAKHHSIIYAIIAALLLVIIAFVMGRSLYRSKYESSKEETASAISDSFYQAAYTATENAYHVTNNASISIGDIRTESKLVVLKLTDVQFVCKSGSDEKTEADWQKTLLEIAVTGNPIVALTALIPNNSDNTVWLQITGNGEYLVDMSMAEFIVDSNRNYIKVRVPSPVLSNITITDINELLLKNNSWTNDGSIKQGEKMATVMISIGQLLVEHSLKSNVSYYGSAIDSAKTLITNMIRQFNLNNPDLVIEVEFFD